MLISAEGNRGPYGSICHLDAGMDWQVKGLVSDWAERKDKDSLLPYKRPTDVIAKYIFTVIICITGDVINCGLENARKSPTGGFSRSDWPSGVCVLRLFSLLR